MSHLNKEDIQKLSDLCRIKCTEEEQESILKDLESILTYIDLLNEVNTENVQPCNHVLSEIHNVMREDVCGPTLNRDVFLKLAPSHKGGLIDIPPVLTKTNIDDL